MASIQVGDFVLLTASRSLKKTKLARSVNGLNELNGYYHNNFRRRRLAGRPMSSLPAVGLIPDSQ